MFTRRTSLPESIRMPPWWRRIASAHVVVIALLVGLVCARPTGREADTATVGLDQARYHDHSFRVARVIDGDTLDIEAPDGAKDVTRIRLWGVDTPEIGHGAAPDMYFGPEAAAYAKRVLLGRNVHIVLSPKQTRGKYGRLLAYVFVSRGGAMFNEMLLEGGYAYADLRFPHHYSRSFRATEERSRRAGAGLWAGITPERMPAWKRRFERPRGDSRD